MTERRLSALGVLLPKPWGFEGFLAIEVDPLARDQAGRGRG
jgi:hypothetical protein